MTKYDRYQGVEYKAKHITTKFYNKQNQSKCQEAYGILRQEATLIEPKDIQKILGSRKPTLLDITRDLVTDYLKEDLNKLALLDNSIATRNTAHKMLCDAHGEALVFITSDCLISKRISQEKVSQGRCTPTQKA